MVVVRAERHPRLRCVRRRLGSGQVPDDVVTRPLLAEDIGVNRHGQIRQREPCDVWIRIVKRLLYGLKCLVRQRREQGVGHLRADARGDDPRAGNRRVEGHGDGFPGIRRPRSRHHQHRLRPALTSRERLVSKIRVPGKNRLRFLLGILGEVAEHEHDFIFHVERRIAVVPESLALRNDDAVAGEDDVAGDVAVVGK